jgi:hypothetical protein
MRIRDPRWKTFGSGIRNGKHSDPGFGMEKNGNSKLWSKRLGRRYPFMKDQEVKSPCCSIRLPNKVIFNLKLFGFEFRKKKNHIKIDNANGTGYWYLLTSSLARQQSGTQGCGSGSTL